ncbi:MAG TPA: rhomboid family intramembrane serine protease [Flavobacterium sp.]|nr:rhomboid family intramembrane serine protease [Flavobacterium sp.]
MSLIDDLKLQFRMGDVTTKLIFWNVLFFAIPEVVFAFLQLSNIHINYLYYISLSSNPSELLWKPWSLISYNFFHAGIWHLIFNMLMLSFAGRLFLTFFTQKQLLGLYLTGGIFAGGIYILCYMFFPALVNINASLIGASAAIMCILFATVSYSPTMPVRLLIFGNVKLWHIALVLVFVDLISLPANNTGGHLAHLGGAFFGYIYIWQLKSGRDLSKWVSAVLDLFDSSQKAPFKKVHKNYRKPETKKASKIVTKDKAQQQIDEILDKISRSGYDSLTKEEKEFLFRAGKQ